MRSMNSSPIRESVTDLQTPPGRVARSGQVEAVSVVVARREQRRESAAPLATTRQ